MSTSKRFVTKNGLDNNGNSITNLGVSGASLTLSGANALTFTTSGATNVTFPTSGTLLTTAGTAATVTTNANLTGPITSVGNATSIASQTGTGTTFVMSASPSITGFLNITGSGAYMPASTTIAAATGATSGSLITSQGTAGTAGAAFITFHRPSAHAFHVGIDTDNFFKIGGYSLGAASYKIWHEGVDGAGSGLDADLLDGQQGAYYAPIASPVFTGIPRTPGLNIGADSDIYLYESSTNALSIRTGGVGTEKYFTFSAAGVFTTSSGGITSTGVVGIGAPATGASLNISKSFTGSVSTYGIAIPATVASDSTSGAYGVATYIGTQATAFTLGTLMHYNADQAAIGAGSTVTNQYGYVASAGLVGATNNYGFYGGIPAGTNRYNLYMTGTAQNYMAGNTGIGNSAFTDTKLRLGGSIGTATSLFGTYTDPTLPATNTVATIIHTTAPATAASAFTLGQLVHYRAYQGTIGAGSAVTSQYGFQAASTLTGATNNYGFHGGIDAGTNRYNLYMSGTANNYLEGSLGIGINSLAGHSLRVNKALTGATTTLGIRQSGIVQSDSTVEAYGILNEFGTQATAFTLPSYVHLGASQGTIGAGSTVTTQYGLYISSNLVGATNNYGVFSAIPSGTNRYNIYAQGTAENYFAGKVGIGTLLSSNTFFRVSGSGTGTDTSTVIAQGTTTASSTHNVFYSLPTTSATTLNALTHFFASQSTLGGTVNNQYGFRADALNIGATNNYGFLAENTAAVTTGKTGFGFYSNINTATGGGSTWGFFGAGTANNAFNGKVRVGGITVPSATLDVTGTIASTGAITATGGVDKLTTASGVVSVAAATAPSTGQVLMATSATTATWQTPAAGGTVTLSDDTATNATYYPTIATATSGTLSALKVSSTKFTFNPSTGTMSATILNSLSDANFKTNVVPLTDSAEVVKALQGVSFDWKDGSGSSYGFIAQEVQKIIPHAVSENDNKLGVNYSAIVPFLVETIKTQEDRIARLEEMVAKLLKA